MILVDTSAWVELDRATGSAVDLALADLIATDGPIAVTEPIVMEVCAGARTDARERDLRRLLARCHLARVDAAADFNGAVTIDRTCRRAGITPRGLIDCVIAAVALRGAHEVLVRDGDLVGVARIMELRLHPASPR
ncbi:type II toxin-antitoxin system VapC family toxin [Agilicoccus flavus]|uniref:type II toxin-antitoxin system VapC family toxin n=1 Tax=Agilicoccus flavus TaxID=2775968 RepID=UPI001CF6929B|nr:PIN domain nuclease [Agilicoccus flavus]